jgi:anti-sigma factor RsiW
MNDHDDLDRLDELLSARMDGRLTNAEHAELETLLADEPLYRERARAFEEVDHHLEALAEESISEERLASTLANLRARLDLDSADASTGSRPSRFVAGGLGKLSERPAIPLLLAAAAAFLFYLIVAQEPNTMEAPAEVVADAKDPAGVEEFDFNIMGSALEDELVLVLGYGDEMSPLRGITSDDMDVIEQLDLLDFLSTRESSVGELEERG